MKVHIPRRLAGAVALAFLLSAPVTAMAQVPAGIGSFVSYGYGTGVHTIGSTTAFPNFDQGAVNNRYPLAQVEQDASPSSAARASFSDTGPLAATAGSQYNQGCSAGNPPPPPSACSNPNNSVPYANSNYPGGPDNAHVDSCGGQSSCPSAHADSDASELAANASGVYAGGGTQPFSGASSESHTYVTSAGVLTVITHSEVQNFVIGTVSISKVVVDTVATATNGSASADAHIVVGSVTVNGQPVSINGDGVTVGPQSASCPSPPTGPVPVPVPGGPVPSPPSGGGGIVPSPPALPGAHTGCVPPTDATYIKIFAVAPERSVNGTHATILASGLHILVTHPTPGPGVPQQSTEYVLGEGYADAGTGSGGGGFPGGGFGFTGGDFGFNGPGPDNGGLGSPNSAANVAREIFANRWWPLVLLFLTLEALILGSAAAWVWARNAPKEDVADEVLSP
ncbi:MAG TPA: hypothetical protein VFL29_10310 [Candidatus Dormibacteraeota bacterium]|nr:hypothetical protein [Candidatus Dormibacteraeota bacterium]